MSKPLAKSLHTHTVLVNFALHLLAQNPRAYADMQPKAAARALVRQCLVILESEEKADPYGLAERAIEHVARDIADIRKSH